MRETTPEPVSTTLRIPGNWTHPRELIDRLPDGVRLTADALVLGDGTHIQFSPLPPDDQFAYVFNIACRRSPHADEMAVINDYTMNVGLTGPGGSLQSALMMMRAGAAIVHAGGAGVFIDNSALAHGAADWIEMTDDGGPDALSFAFAGIVHSRYEVFTVGMHVMGFPEIVMRRADVDDEGQTIMEFIRNVCRGDKPIRDGLLLADDRGMQFHVVAISHDKLSAGTPMFNRFGRLKLVNVTDIANQN